jgi:hypothetical protein
MLIVIDGKYLWKLAARAGVEDYQFALATYRAACERWPGTLITLSQGARVIEDSRRMRTASWSNKGSREGGR